MFEGFYKFSKSAEDCRGLGERGGEVPRLGQDEAAGCAAEEVSSVELE